MDAMLFHQASKGLSWGNPRPASMSYSATSVTKHVASAPPGEWAVTSTPYSDRSSPGATPANVSSFNLLEMEFNDFLKSEWTLTVSNYSISSPSTHAPCAILAFATRSMGAHEAGTKHRSTCVQDCDITHRNIHCYILCDKAVELKIIDSQSWINR